MPKELITQTELAARYDVTRETVSDWVAKGAIKKRSDGKYDFAACIISLYRWQASRLAGRTGNAGGLDLSAERAKLAAEQSAGISIKNALARGDLIPRRVVERFMVNDYTLVRERMLVIAGKVADALASTEHPRHEVEAIISEEINECLNELHDPASFNPLDTGEGEADSSEGFEAAAEADADRVGESIPPRRGEDLGKPGSVED